MPEAANAEIARRSVSTAASERRAVGRTAAMSSGSADAPAAFARRGSTRCDSAALRSRARSVGESGACSYDRVERGINEPIAVRSDEAASKAFAISSPPGSYR